MTEISFLQNFDEMITLKNIGYTFLVNHQTDNNRIKGIHHTSNVSLCVSTNINRIEAYKDKIIVNGTTTLKGREITHNNKTIKISPLEYKFETYPSKVFGEIVFSSKIIVHPLPEDISTDFMSWTDVDQLLFALYTDL